MAIYDLAGGLFPPGKCRFEDNELRSVGALSKNVRVTLKSGEILIIDGRHYTELEKKLINGF